VGSALGAANGDGSHYEQRYEQVFVRLGANFLMALRNQDTENTYYLRSQAWNTAF